MTFQNMVTGRVSYLLVFAVILGIYQGCDRKSRTAQGVSADSLLIQYQALTDSVDSNWMVMIDDDDQKHFLMNRLLQEVSYTNNYDKARLEQLTMLLDELIDMRYDQQTMSDSDLIDAYDSATFAVCDQIFAFARSHPRFESIPIMAELIEDINARNNYILMHRIHYDNWVKELNEFKKNNKDAILSGDASIDVEEMPLFQLPF
jgi:hypothetical protein